LIKKNIKIGINAGKIDQGEFSIAIGNNAGVNTQKNKTIILNANDQELNSDVSNAFYVKPIRNTEGTSMLQYDNSSGEISYSNNISNNLSLNCNLLNDVSGINFCDGTYIGSGSSFDISINQVLKIYSNNGISQAINTDGDTLLFDGNELSNLNLRVEKLQIHSISSAGASSGLYCYDTTLNNSSRLELYKNESGDLNSFVDASNNSTLGFIGFNGVLSGNYVRGASIRSLVEDPVNLASNIRFLTRGNTGNENEKMRIASNGNVGINNTNPTQKLDVGGNINSFGDIISQTNLNSSASFYFQSKKSRGTSSIPLPVQNNDDIGGMIFIGYTVSGGYKTGAGIQAKVRNPTATTAPMELNFYTGGAITTENLRMKIDSFGNVGIGTTTPQEKLDVSGNITINNNLINDVSGLNFSDGSYIGSGNSFDISTNDTLNIKSNQNVLIKASNVVRVNKPVSAPSFLSLHQFQGFPENTKNLIDITDISGYFGGVLAPNGKIYGFPGNNKNVLVIDPETGSANTTEVILTVDSSLNGIYAGGVLAPNGKIYGIPASASNILVIDPETGTANTTEVSLTIGSSLNGTYVGGVLAPNGKIYGIPSSASNVLIIDPVAGTANTTDISGITGSGAKYNGGVLAPNGKIYGIPVNVQNILVIDPETDTANTSEISLTIGSSLNETYVGGVLAPNGKIYGIPNSASNVLIIDPVAGTANTTDISGITGSGAKYAGGVLGLNGKIYGMPSTSQNVLIIDPEAGTANQTDISGLPVGDRKCFGGVLAPNGNIYGIPRDATNVLQIKTGLPKHSPWMLEAYFNKL
jgi:hypothetical protein